jgi:hypothetical protein
MTIDLNCENYFETCKLVGTKRIAQSQQIDRLIIWTMKFKSWNMCMIERGADRSLLSEDNSCFDGNLTYMTWLSDHKIPEHYNLNITSPMVINRALFDWLCHEG